MISIFKKTPNKTPAASFVLQMMDGHEDGDGMYDFFANKASAIFQISREEIDKQLESFI